MSNCCIKCCLAVALALSLVWLTGCQPPMERMDTAKLQEAVAAPAKTATTEPKATPKATESAAEPDAALEQALLAPLDSGKQPRFDVQADGIPVRSFFASLVADTGTNIVVHPQVQGEITLQLHGVTLPEVLNIVQQMYGYRYEAIAGGYTIRPGGLQTELFQLNYLTLQRSGQSSTRVSSGGVSDEGNSDSNGDSDISGNSSDTSATGSRIETQSQVDFWPELQTALSTIVGSEGGRKVVMQPQAGVVLVRAQPQELQQVSHYLETVQGNMQRQVVLEAKIIEVELTDGTQTGINWSGLVEGGAGDRSVFGQTGGGKVLRDGSSEIATNSGNLRPNSPSVVDAFETSAFGGVFAATLEFKNFQAFVEALQSQGQVHVLSSPRISTLNNQKAIIKVGSDEFFVTDVSSDTVTGTTTTTTPDITLTPFFSGIALDVTPQISPNGMVTMHVHPSVSEVQDQTKVVTVAGQEQTLPLAKSNVRESDTIVRARSGQMVVIGGLMKDSSSRDEAGIPGAASVPLVGNLFKQQQQQTRKSELVILLRPQVIHSPADWQGHLQQVQHSLDRFQSSGN